MMDPPSSKVMVAPAGPVIEKLDAFASKVMEARKVLTGTAATVLITVLVFFDPVKMRSASTVSVNGVNPNTFQFVGVSDGATPPGAAPVSQLLSIAPVQVRTVARRGSGLETTSARSAAAEVRRMRGRLAAFITGRGCGSGDRRISTVEIQVRHAQNLSLLWMEFGHEGNFGGAQYGRVEGGGKLSCSPDLGLSHDCFM